MRKAGVSLAVGSTKQYYYDSICNVKDEELPEEYIIPYLPKLLDQGSVGSCVAHALAETLQVNIHQQVGSDDEVSVLVIYGGWREDWEKDSGMYPEVAIKNGMTVGTCLKKYSPENIEVLEVIGKAREFIENNPEKLEYKVGSYFKIRKNGEFFSYLKKAIYQFNLPIPVTVYNRGNHEEIAVGWDKEGNVILQNSWGEYGPNKDGLHKWKPKSIKEAYLVIMADVAKVPFKDIEGHWAEKHIKNAYFAGYINGRTETSFEPEGMVKRGELAKLVDLLNTNIDEGNKILEEEIKAIKKENETLRETINKIIEKIGL